MSATALAARINTAASTYLRYAGPLTVGYLLLVALSPLVTSARQGYLGSPEGLFLIGVGPPFALHFVAFYGYVISAAVLAPPETDLSFR